MDKSDFYYIEDDLIVLTKEYLLSRGFCCGNFCRNCPYGEDIQRAAAGLSKEENEKQNRNL